MQFGNKVTLLLILTWFSWCNGLGLSLWPRRTSIFHKGEQNDKLDKMDPELSPPSPVEDNVGRNVLLLKKPTVAGVALLGLAGAALASIFWPFAARTISPPWEVPYGLRRYSGRSMDARQERISDYESQQGREGRESISISFPLAVSRCLSTLKGLKEVSCRDAFLCQLFKEEDKDCECPAIVRKGFSEKSESRGVSPLLLPVLNAWEHFQNNQCGKDEDSNCANSTALHDKPLIGWNDCHRRDE